MRAPEITSETEEGFRDFVFAVRAHVRQQEQAFKASRVELHEKDPEYRKAVIRALSLVAAKGVPSDAELPVEADRK
jgi:hypothetical protein